MSQSSATVEMVKPFCVSSTKMQWLEDDAPVNSADKKAHLQKRLILCEIKEGILKLLSFSQCVNVHKKKNCFAWREW